MFYVIDNQKSEKHSWLLSKTAQICWQHLERCSLLDSALFFSWLKIWMGNKKHFIWELLQVNKGIGVISLSANSFPHQFPSLRSHELEIEDIMQRQSVEMITKNQKSCRIWGQKLRIVFQIFPNDAYRATFRETPAKYRSINFSSTA